MGVGHHIHLTMQPTRPSPADAIRIVGRLKDPAASKYDGRPSHRRAITPIPEHGMVSIVGPGGLFYANAVGTFGAVASGRNWDLLASAARRWPLKLVDEKEFTILLIPGDTGHRRK